MIKEHTFTRIIHHEPCFKVEIRHDQSGEVVWSTFNKKWALIMQMELEATSNGLAEWILNKPLVAA